MKGKMGVLTGTDHHENVLLRGPFWHRAVREDTLLSGLITQRSLVQIQPPPPQKSWSEFFPSGGLFFLSRPSLPASLLLATAHG